MELRDFFWISALFSGILFFIPKSFKYGFTFLIELVVLAVSTNWAIDVLMDNSSIEMVAPLKLLTGDTIIKIDTITSFFILLVNFTVFTGLIYSKGYLKPYYNIKSTADLSIHYFSFFWLHFSMLLVTMMNNSLGFLIAWEIMSLSSFFLVLFDNEKKETIKIGINYFIQMHFGFLMLVIGFVLAYKYSNTLSFEGIRTAFTEVTENAYFTLSAFVLFLFFFIGFGIKAGFIPLHTWLPHAHPAAPSHVSGVMSGVMIKMGIYGIIRIISFIPNEHLLWIGVFILIISLISGLYGVMLAIVQHDLKKLLAYHSIENIGIIGIGIGLGCIGLATNQMTMFVLGFTGGLLHVLNHSLFKSLLFYTAGSVYKATHTRDIESLGGLIKNMPKTAILFLIGAIAISGLPPFNGFVSEFLIYSGLFQNLDAHHINEVILIIATIIGLVLIGGLALFCFTKAFGMVFLGTPRSKAPKNANEVESSMIFPNLLIVLAIIAIGILPTVFYPLILKTITVFNIDNQIIAGITQHTNHTLLYVGISSGVLILLVALIYFIKYTQHKKVKVVYGPTWGCGYTGADPALHQYTATSFANNYTTLVEPVLEPHKHYEDFKEEEIFPLPKSFESHYGDKIENKLIVKPVNTFIDFFQKLGVLQTGRIRDYIIYPLVFILLISLLTFLKII
jgi:formate hydrogenlyase subunit 3/multisubunit Na+/H+ antiporter MnhD subunit